MVNFVYNHIYPCVYDTIMYVTNLHEYTIFFEMFIPIWYTAVVMYIQHGML